MNKKRIPFYAQNIETFNQELTKCKRRHAQISLLRLIIFIGIVVSWSYVVTINQSVGVGSGLACVLIFVISLRWHQTIEDRILYLESIIKINSDELKCCNGDFSSFENGDEFTDHHHSYSYDIDLFGDGSLFQYLNRTVTIKGRMLLAKWLSSSQLTKDEIVHHQQAIHEFSGMVEFRQAFMTIGCMHQSKLKDEDAVQNWLNLPSFFKHKKVIISVLIGVPIYTLTILLLVVFKQIPMIILVLTIIVNLIIIGSRLKAFNKRYQLISESHQILKTISNLISSIEGQDFDDAHILALKAKLSRDKISASKQIRQLTRMMNQLDNRNNLLMGSVLNALFFWDWHHLYRIEKWQASHQFDFDHWLGCIAEIDALITLANLSYNNTDYCFPEVDEREFIFEAKNLGHPLLPHEKRIYNDFTLNESPRYGIITGANMAGKSTFLRTIASNLVLAGCGAAVCASSFKFYPIKLYTSMRAEDSLIEGESYFYAELKRLQQITSVLDQDEKIFIILDEILRGTNSEDKRKGSIGFIEKITEKQAYGIVATHDLELARLVEQKPEVFKALCFEVKFVNEGLQFDYKLSEGVTKNMNASFLMKSMGIIH